MKLLHEHHDAPVAGHLGISKTYELLSRNYFWPAMQSEPAGLLQPLPIPVNRWDQVAMDFVVQLPKTKNGWDAILVCIDRLTKRAHFAPTKTTASAPETANIFFETVVKQHGLPKTIVTDRDSKFTSLFWKTLFKRFGTKLAMSTAYHPQTDGQTERMNRILQDMLRHFVNYQQNDWDQYLSLAEVAYNNAEQQSTGMSPFYLDTGRHPSFPGNLMNPEEQKVEYVEQFLKKQQENNKQKKV